MHPDPEFNLEDFLPYVLNMAAEESSLAFQKIYKSRYGMLRTEWRVLSHLGTFGEMTAKDIGQMSRMHKTKISRAVRALEIKRFVTRETQTTDRRHENLSLTSAGRAAFDDIRQRAIDHNKTLKKQFSDADYAVLIRCLQQLAKLHNAKN